MSSMSLRAFTVWFFKDSMDNVSRLDETSAMFISKSNFLQLVFDTYFILKKYLERYAVLKWKMCRTPGYT